MATNYKVLGQVAPLATTATTVYTVPSATQAVASSIVVCNRGSTSGTFRISVRPNNASISNEHYIIYDTDIAANDTVILTFGLTLDSGDVVEVYGSTADFSFNIYGSEIS
jgi:hypothetical protein